MKLSLVLAIGAATSVAMADSVTIDFQNLEVIGYGYVNQGNTVVEDGFQIFQGGAGLFSLGTLEAEYAGSTGLTTWNGYGTSTLTKVGGGAFSMASIDLAQFRLNKDALTVRFSGTLPGGGTVVQDFLVPASGSVNSFQTYAFGSGWNNLFSVSWATLSGGHSNHQYDNILLGPASVPLPTASALAGLGLLGLGVRRRRGSL